MAIFEVSRTNGSIGYGAAGEAGVVDFPKTGGPGGVGGPGGGIKGGGTIWSSCEQVAWFSFNGGPAVPVYLHPGNNDVRFWLPSIYPEDDWVESEITIEVTGYILIPAGFEWEIMQAEDAPERPPYLKQFDKLKIVDKYDVDLIHVQGPLEDDELEDINIEDTFNAELVSGPQTYEDDELENISITDDYDTELHLGPQIYEDDELEEFSLEDTFETELETGPIYPTGENIDDIETEDIVDTDLNPNN